MCILVGELLCFSDGMALLCFEPWNVHYIYEIMRAHYITKMFVVLLMPRRSVHH